MFLRNINTMWQDETFKKATLIGAVLIVFILLTRTNHFGDNVYLPDATLAVLFLGGLFIKRGAWLGLAIVAAFGMDFYALGFKGVSDYCMSLGYWGLIPTYALVWGAGRWLATQQQSLAAMPYALTAWAASSLAFVLSNAFWYAFSDKVNTLSVIDFSQRVAQYYTPYVGFCLMYLGAAWLVLKALKQLNAQQSTQRV
jgi:hypothetical protein